MDRRHVATVLAAIALLATACTGGGDGVQPSEPAEAPQSVPVPFLWGAATSSYQVEGGIDCSRSSLPCNDYDFFNSNPTIHETVEFNTGKAGPSSDLAAAGRADDFWHPDVYKRDFDNAQLLGLNSFRISLEWARIEPNPPTVNADGSLSHHWDQAAIDHYRTMIEEMRERGLEPIISLNHFTLPIWVLKPPSDWAGCVTFCHPTDGEAGYVGSMRGWLNAETVKHWVEFVERIVPELRDLVDYWLTINEPVGSQVVLGYVAGVWSPGFVSDGAKAKAVLHNLIVAHVRAYDAIHTCAPVGPTCDNVDSNGDGIAAEVGFAHAMGPTVALPPGPLGNAGLNRIAATNFAYFTSQYFLNAVVFGIEDKGYIDSAGSDPGVLPADCLRFADSPTRVQGGTIVPNPDWVGRLDFLGINYYRRFHVYHDDRLSLVQTGFIGGNTHNNMWGEPASHEILNDLGWAIYPQGLYEMIMCVHNIWHLPAMITENGMPERTDSNRAAHIVAHVREVQRAISDGANVIGYLYWTLMDNWELHEQYRPEARFGLFHVDRSDPALPRHITEGAFAYQQVIAESRATSSNGAPTNKALDAAEDAFGTVARDGSRIVPPTRTHGRFWEGTTSEGEAFTLYLGYIEATGQMTGMIFRRAVGGWRQMELLVDGQGSFFRESWHDDATGKTAHRDYRVTYGNGEWRGTFGGSAVVTAARVPGAGTWKWRGRSPWGGDHFYVSKFEGLYSGKFLTFSAPISGRDEPRPQCGPGCIPDVSGPVWKPFRTVEADPLLRLDGSGLEGEGLFDVSLAFDGPGAATTVSRNSGKFTVSKAANIFDGLFDLTGYLSPRGDFTWSGERNGSVVSQFRFLERRGIAIERPKKPASIGGDDDQYYKENDPTSVMPLEGFSYAPHFGGATVSFEAGGRRYQTSTDVFVCLSPAVCTGTWSDIAGMHAERLSEKFPPVPYAGPDRRIRARGKDAVIRLDGTGSFDLDGQALLYAWTGDFGTVVGPTPSVSLGVGTHEVCLDVTNGIETSRDCVTINVVRGPR